MARYFSKFSKLSKTDHVFIFFFFLGVLYIAGILFRFLQFKALLAIFLVLYALLFVFLEHRGMKGSVYQMAMVHIPKYYNSNGSRISSEPLISKVYKRKVDFKKYLSSRTNGNLFISGRSGSGKSTLMRYIIELFSESNKLIFSFKAGDEYLKMGIPILRISDYASNPFADKEAFVQAYLVTYPITSQGITAASVPNLLRTFLKESNSWESFKKALEKEMKEHKEGSITHSACTFIYQKIADLELKSSGYELDTNTSVVLDFSGLNESAKTFYAELYLRQAWHAIESNQVAPMKRIIIIDEAHRLLKSEATIFGDTARLIRSKGALWCGTQNYSDLPDSVRNQFAIQLLFSTKSDKDLKALKSINALLPFVATELHDHHFTDAAMQSLHEAIPIYTADIAKFKDVEAAYLKTERIKEDTQEIPLQPTPEYTEKVLAMLTQEASWPNKLAKIIANDEKIDVGKAKFAVSKALHTLQKDGKIDRQMLKFEDKEVMLYYKRDPSMSGLHKFMEKEVTKKLEEKGILYELAKQGEDKPDIMTEDFDIEIETGLKHDITKLEERLAKATKKTYVVVSNEAEKERYIKVDLTLTTVILLENINF